MGGKVWGFITVVWLFVVLVGLNILDWYLESHTDLYRDVIVDSNYTKIDGIDNLVYNNDTFIVYSYIKSVITQGESIAFAPYISENGNYYKYDRESNSIVELSDD